MWKGNDTLAILLQHEFEQDPFDGAYYLFCGTRSDRFEVLHWDGEGLQLFYKRLENGEIHWLKAKKPQLENLKAERSIKELVIGRKNWLFSSNLAGAQSSGIILSLKVTAELNGLSPVKYFQLLLEELPTLYFEGCIREKIQAYLPLADYVQEKSGD